jgi:hypothetical protein
MASDERRAADRGVVGVDDRELERVLLDPISMEKLLRALTDRIRNPGVGDVSARWVVERRRELVADLSRAVDDVGSARVVSVSVAPQDAVRVVLSSPRAIREVLDGLAELAAEGDLLDGRHSGTVNAARRLLQALINSRTLRPR